MKKNLLLIIIVILITMFATNFIIERTQERTTNEIVKAIRIEDVEMTEDGILVQLDIQGELNYYFWEDKVVVEAIEE